MHLLWSGRPGEQQRLREIPPGRERVCVPVYHLPATLAISLIDLCRAQNPWRRVAMSLESHLVALDGHQHCEIAGDVRLDELDARRAALEGLRGAGLKRCEFVTPARRRGA